MDWEDDYDKFIRIFAADGTKRLAFNNYQKLYKREKYKTDEDYRNKVKKYMRDYYHFTKSMRDFNNNKLFPNFSNFSLKLSEVFNNSYNTNGITLRWIRISAATYYSKKYQKNFNKRKQIAYYMAHSFVENNLYTKYDSDDSEY